VATQQEGYNDAILKRSSRVIASVDGVDLFALEWFRGTQLLEPIAAPASKFVTKGRTFCHRCEKRKALAAIPKEVVYNGALVPVAKLPKPVALVVGLRSRGEGKLEITVDQDRDEHRWCPGCGYLMVWRNRHLVVGVSAAAYGDGELVFPAYKARDLPDWEAYVRSYSPNPGIKRGAQHVVKGVIGSAKYQGIDKKLLSGIKWEKIPDWPTDYYAPDLRRLSGQQVVDSPPWRVGDEMRPELRGLEDLEELLEFLRQLFNDKARRIHFLYSFPAVPEPPAGYFDRWFRIQQNPKQDVLPGLYVTQPYRSWRPATYRVQSWRERIDRCLDSTVWHPRLLVDFDSEIYTDETKINGGAFIPASMGAIVAHGYMHEQLMRRAGMFKEKLEQYFEPYDPNAYEEPEKEKAIADMPEEEKKAELEKLLSTTGEIEGLKARGRKGTKYIGDDETTEVVDESQDRTETGDREFDEADGNYFEGEEVHNPIIDDDEDTSGVGHLEHIVDQRDTRPQTTVLSATKLLDHRDLEAIRALSRVKPPPFPLEIYNRYDEIRETAEKMNITENALQKRVTDHHQEALLMYDNKIPYNLVKTKHRLTEEQLQAVAEGKAHYILLEMNGEWVWRKLDVAKHGTLDEAIEAFRQEVILKAFQRRPGGKKTCVDGAVATRDWNEVMAEYKEKFDRAFFLSTRPRWRGLIGRSVEDK
jgi:hypothetical protein